MGRLYHCELQVVAMRMNERQRKPGYEVRNFSICKSTPWNSIANPVIRLALSISSSSIRYSAPSTLIVKNILDRFSCFACSMIAESNLHHLLAQFVRDYLCGLVEEIVEDRPQMS
jgi:hypothetical protein